MSKYMSVKEMNDMSFTQQVKRFNSANVDQDDIYAVLSEWVVDPVTAEDVKSEMLNND